jgi:hypothetical protein
MVIYRCDCHRWHTYTPHPKHTYFCVCGRDLKGKDLTYQEIWDLLEDEEQVAQWMRENNDMEGSCFLRKGKYD